MKEELIKTAKCFVIAIGILVIGVGGLIGGARIYQIEAPKMHQRALAQEYLRQALKAEAEFNARKAEIAEKQRLRHEEILSLISDKMIIVDAAEWATVRCENKGVNISHNIINRSNLSLTNFVIRYTLYNSDDIVLDEGILRYVCQVPPRGYQAVIPFIKPNIDLPMSSVLKLHYTLADAS